jgi:hypothetical protein
MSGDGRAVLAAMVAVFCFFAGAVVAWTDPNTYHPSKWCETVFLEDESLWQDDTIRAECEPYVREEP